MDALLTGPRTSALDAGAQAAWQPNSVVLPIDLDTLADAVASRVVARLVTRPQFVDRKELARILGVSVSTIERLQAQGEISFIRCGSRVLYDPVAVADSMQHRTAKGGRSHA